MRFQGVSQLCLSFILHFVAYHVSVFILTEIYLSIQYSSETVTHLLSMMIAECSSVSLLLFLLHSYAFCYCKLQLSQVSAIKHTSNGMQNRKCRIFLTLHKTPHTNFPLAHTPTSQFVAQKFPQGQWRSLGISGCQLTQLQSVKSPSSNFISVEECAQSP